MLILVADNSRVLPSFTQFDLSGLDYFLPRISGVRVMPTSNPSGEREPTDSLAPWFLFVLDEHSISSRFKLRRCFVDAVNVKLKPCLWGRNILRPGIFAKTRLAYSRYVRVARYSGSLHRLDEHGFKRTARAGVC